MSLNKNACAVVLSNCTDVCGLLLRYIYAFQNNRLSEFWMRYGTENVQSFIPVHPLYGSPGHNKSSVIQKAHYITGYDVTSELGTKNRALKVF